MSDPLVDLWAETLGAAPSAPIYVSVDGRTVEPSRLEAAVRRLLDDRLVKLCDPLGVKVAQVDLDDVCDAALATCDVALDRGQAQGVIDALEAAGHVLVVARRGGLVELRPGRGPPPAPAPEPPETR